MLEIRGHARGGQGMVTAFEILAKVFSKLDDFQVQAFPAFGVERTGAPIQAFLRIAKKEILNRSNIYHPHLIIIFDESLIDQIPVFEGLQSGGAVLINSERPLDRFRGFAERVYTVPATAISLSLGLGSKSLPIINAAMIGAILRIFEADLSIGQAIVKANVPAKPEANAESLEKAYEQVVGVDERNDTLLGRLHAPPVEKRRSLDELFFEEVPKPEGLSAPYWSEPMSKNKTGNWRLMTPTYVDRTPPCTAGCPAGTDVRAFVKLAAERKFQEAFDTIYQHNPFPAICGRVCPNFCEQNCNRNELDEGVNIGAIERFVGDKAFTEKVQPSPLRHKERIAVIGSGPAGLTAALRLREKGYPVTVFEALPHAGGMMRSGIPKFRLPDEVLDREIDLIQRKGVEILLNRKVKVDELSEDFDAVITAVGSHIGAELGLDNEELVKDGISFLNNFKLNGALSGIKPGDKVAIIGGGNTAIDVSRTVLRFGATPIIFYRRTIREMPAIAQEVREAQVEGVRFQFLTAPTGVSRSDHQIALDLIRMQLGEPDDSGRRRPEPLPLSKYTLKVDHVITAVGQRSDNFAFGNTQVAPKQGRIEYKGNKAVFCAGDMAWGGTVTEAIGSGNKVAAEVDAFLSNEKYDPKETLPEVVLPEDINFTYFLPSPRHHAKLHHPRNFYQDFTEVAKEMTEEDIIAETGRCLQCGECFSCGNCFNFCPDAAIHVDEHGRLRIDYEYCKGCGICVQECPCSAIDFKLTEAAVS
jgi:2-oxoacid:acceptor oxidoreductase gamma subunit (pyruvate/2-ketoisovalerate family)/2-oxoacid:acceptor oxidoreductase delta subunit (pyruvate/2-ketoisovalerate family)